MHYHINLDNIKQEKNQVYVKYFYHIVMNKKVQNQLIVI